MFVFVFSLVGISGSYAGKIKNCSNCGNSNNNDAQNKTLTNSQSFSKNIDKVIKPLFYENDYDLRCIIWKCVRYPTM